LHALSEPALSLALASAYALSGPSQAELCSTTLGLRFREDPITSFPISNCVASDYFLDRWVCSDLSTESLLLFGRILDAHSWH